MRLSLNYPPMYDYEKVYYAIVSLVGYDMPLHVDILAQRVYPNRDARIRSKNVHAQLAHLKNRKLIKRTAPNYVSATSILYINCKHLAEQLEETQNVIEVIKEEIIRSIREKDPFDTYKENIETLAILSLKMDRITAELCTAVRNGEVK